jgi:hypothetical protein
MPGMGPITGARVLAEFGDHLGHVELARLGDQFVQRRLK